MGSAAAAIATSASGIMPQEYHASFPPPPQVFDPLDQGPFEQVMPREDRMGRRAMVTAPTDAHVPNWGMGYVVYPYEESGTPTIEGETEAESIEKLARLPFVSNFYMRLDWRDIQQRSGQLNFPEMWKWTFELAKTLNKRVSVRVQLASPNIFPTPSAPDFVLERSGGGVELNKRMIVPRYEHPEFQAAFRDLNRMLAAELDQHPNVEFIDLMGYGPWGEWHSGGKDCYFQDSLTAVRTLNWMIEEQMDAWRRTPLVMGAHGGQMAIRLKELIATAIRGGCWLRRDSVGRYMYSNDITMLTERPSWVAAVIEEGAFRRHGLGDPKDVEENGLHNHDQLMFKALDLRGNYWALWQCAENILTYREAYPRGFEMLDRHLGYKVRPSWVFVGEDDQSPYVILAIRNDGCAAPPGILRVYLVDAEGRFRDGGGFDPGTPEPFQVRQCRIRYPKGLDWTSLRAVAELEVNGHRHPVRWACHEPVNDDGSLNLHPTNGLHFPSNGL